MRRLIEWAEKDIARGRKLMLFSTIFCFLIVTLTVLVLIAVGRDMSGFTTFYYSFATIAGVAIGFYTGTTPKRSQPEEPN